MAVLIEAKQDDPIVDRTWPFTVWQKAFGVCSESTEKVRDVRVTPTDENALPLLVRTQVRRQVSGLIVAKAGIDFQIRCVREWIYGQPGTMALV
jgi:hypothetical protein